jgi:hypothetical protein
METQFPDRTATSPTRVTTTNIPQPTPISEPVIDLECEETSAPIRDSSWPRPLKELEKEKAKTSATSSPKPDSRPAPAAQTALNQEQQKKKKQKQQQQQQVSEKQHKEPHPKQTSGASPQPKPTQGASGTTPTTSDKQVVASKKVSAAPSAIRFGQSASNPRPLSSDKLESAKQFIEAWNDADFATGFSTSAPHPAGPSRMFQSLHSVQTSVTEANRVFEVNLSEPCFYFNIIKQYYTQSPRFGSND